MPNESDMKTQLLKSSSVFYTVIFYGGATEKHQKCLNFKKKTYLSIIKRVIGSNLTFAQKNKWLIMFPYFLEKKQIPCHLGKVSHQRLLCRLMSKKTSLALPYMAL